MRFNENDGSRVEQSGVCDVGDKIPPQAITRMGVGHLIPIEEHLLAEGEGQCSTQEEPSPSQAQQGPQGPIDANQRQALDPNPSEQGQDQDQVDGGESSPMVDQGQAQDDEHAQVEGQGEDQNGGDDQGVSQESFKEAQARRARKVEEALHKGSHTMGSAIGSVRRGVSIRRQLANFSSHHAYISCVEPQKVFEALEDPDWLEAMHKELNNFERNKVCHWWRSPRIAAPSLKPIGCSRTSKMRMELL
jgi:hypothetical protein